MTTYIMELRNAIWAEAKNLDHSPRKQDRRAAALLFGLGYAINDKLDGRGNDLTEVTIANVVYNNWIKNTGR